jgi:hypothetical protein
MAQAGAAGKAWRCQLRQRIRPHSAGMVTAQQQGVKRIITATIATPHAMTLRRASGRLVFPDHGREDARAPIIQNSAMR